MVHLSSLVVGEAGGVAAASAVAVVVIVVAEVSMPMAEADTLPGAMQLLCCAVTDRKICHDLNHVQLLGSTAASNFVCA